MKSIVITGSTSGIGFGLADAFLAHDCAVTISGHSQTNLDKAYGILAGKYDKSRILAYLSDVSHYDEVEGLWKASIEKFGHVDIWINNAGSGNPQIPIWNYSRELIDKVVTANVTGAFYGMNVALKGMKQQGFGGIYTTWRGWGAAAQLSRGLPCTLPQKQRLPILLRLRRKKSTALR